MGGVTAQKSRRRIDAYLYKCATPRLYISQNNSDPTTHVQIRNGINCPWSTLYGSTKCSTDNVIVDYTIKVYNRDNQITYQSDNWIYATDPSSYYFLEDYPPLSLTNGGRIEFTAKARREGYIDSDTISATIYSSTQKLVLNVTPATNTTFNGTVGRCYMDTGSITEGVVIRYYHNISSIEMPEAPLAPTSTSGSIYPSSGILIGSNGSSTTYHSITAKAFAENGTDYEESDPVNVQYTMTAPVPTAPTISPQGGNYTVPKTITITEPSGVCDIKYTTDGSNPTTSSPLYTAPFTINQTTTVKAIAQVTGTNIISGVASQTYTIDISQGINVTPPTSITSNSAVFNGYYNGPYSILENSTGFKYKKKEGSSDWITVGTQNGLTQTNYGYSFSGTNTGYLDGNTQYLVKAFTTTSSGDVLESSTIEFSTVNSSTCNLYSISATEQVEFGKINLTYFRFYTYPDSDYPAYYSDAKQYCWCGNKAPLINQWDYIGDKSYTIPIRISRTKGGNMISFNAPANNTTQGTLGTFATHSGKWRAASSGGQVVRDLFGWGTSGNGDGTGNGTLFPCSPHATCYYPFATSTSNADYNPYGVTSTDLMFDGGNTTGKLYADWSQPISYPSELGDPIGGTFGDMQWDGGERVSVNTRAFPGACKGSTHDYYTTRSSKTPSKDELYYLLFTRTTTSGKRYAKGRIQTGTNQYVNGLIVFGDTFDVPNTITDYNTTTAPYTSNTITVDQWNDIYENGAFFLPAAGYRVGVTVTDSNTMGIYWTRTRVNDTKAYALAIKNDNLYFPDIDRAVGGSVRLCGPANIQNRSGCNINIRQKGLGTTTGDGYYNQNASCTVTATPQTGWQFVCWKENGTSVSTSASYTFTVNASRDLEAWFEQIDYTITVNQSPSNTATVTGAGTYYYGDTVTLSAASKPGYSFTSWTEGGNTVCSTNTYIFTCTGNRTLTAVSAVSQITVTATSNPTGAATITGAGNYNSGATCTLSATPESGYQFSKWTENGTQMSTSSNYSFTVSKPMNLVAELTVRKYNITTAVDPTGAGTVSGAQNNVRYGDSVTLTATPGGNYSFLNWKKGTTIVSTNNPYTFSVFETAQYTATFSKNQRTISATVSPSGAGSVTGTGNYDIDASCTLRATANPGYTFVNWTEGGSTVSSNNPYTFVVSVSRQLVANFSQNNYTITTTAGTGGTASGGGTYHYGDSCTITGTPNTGYHFVKWNETTADTPTDITTNPYTFTVTQSAAYAATFEINGYTISTAVSPAGGGSTSGAGSYNHGASVTLVATPATGYNFTRWTKNGTQVSTNASYTFTATESATYTAVFTKKTYNIQTAVSPTGSATVTGAGTYEHGASCTLTATPDSHYNFSKWTKGSSSTSLSTSTSYTFTVTEAATYTANLTGKSYTITASSNNTNYGTVSGGGSKTYNTTCTLTATPNTGYHFVSWTESGSPVSTDNPYSFTVTGARTIVGNFSINTYTVSASSSNTNYGTVSGGGTFNHGAECTVVATPNSGYRFVNWTKNGTQVSTSASYTFAVTGDTALVANFADNTATITVSASPSVGGSVSGGGTKTVGSSCTVSATPATNYAFVNWTEGGNEVSTSASYTFTVSGDRTLVANFSQSAYTPTVTTSSISTYTSTTATTGGNVTSDGGATVTERGVCYGTSQNPTTSGSKVTASGTTGSFTCNLTGLTPNTTYYVRAYATNSVGTAYGSQVSFTTKNRYTISVSASPTAGGSVSGGGNVDAGSSVTVNATANGGYQFVNWTESNTVVSTNASYTISNVSANHTLVANFTRTYTITASAGTGGTISPSGQQTVLSGGNATFEATANNGYAFIGWQIDGSDITTSTTTYTFSNVTSDHTIQARFAVTYEITARANDENMGTVNGSGTYTVGSTVTLTATPATNHGFINWTENDTQVSTSATYTFTVTGDRLVVANFAPWRTVSVQASPNGGGTVSVNGGTAGQSASAQVLQGNTATVAATASTSGDPQYVFAGWHEGTPVQNNEEI